MQLDKKEGDFSQAGLVAGTCPGSLCWLDLKTAAPLDGKQCESNSYTGIMTTLFSLLLFRSIVSGLQKHLTIRIAFHN